MESLHIYPLKSGAGIAAETARLEPDGLIGDRRMMVVDQEGNCLTARTVPNLMRELDARGLAKSLSAPISGDRQGS